MVEIGDGHKYSEKNLHPQILMKYYLVDKIKPFLLYTFVLVIIYLKNEQISYFVFSKRWSNFPHFTLTKNHVMPTI